MGQIADAKMVGKCIKLDFDRSSIPKAIVTVDQNGDWSDENECCQVNGIKVTVHS